MKRTETAQAEAFTWLTHLGLLSPVECNHCHPLIIRPIQKAKFLYFSAIFAY